MDITIWDEIVIGAGMAGLYWIYRTKPKKYLILEKSNRIGGRIYNIKWNENQISLGGGIIKDDNIHTIKLSEELGFEMGEGISKYEIIDWKNKSVEFDPLSTPITTPITTPNKTKPIKNIPNEDDFYKINENIIEYLKKIFNQNKKKIVNKLNFEEFLDLYVDLEIVEIIKSTVLYNCYFTADVESVLYDEIYELLRITDFNFKFIKDGGYTRLLNKLIEIVGNNNICTNQNVVSVSKQSNSEIYEIKTDLNKIYKTKKIIIATECTKSIKFKFDNCKITDKISNIYSMVSGSKYIRVYSHHDFGHGLNFSYKTNGLPGKVIMINDNILMCCYAEEYNAIKLNKLLSSKSKTEQTELIHKLLNNCHIPITKPNDIIIKFWKTGVHYNNLNYNKEKKKY